MIALATLILFLPTSHGAYLAADSRHDGGDPAERDQARKIFLCGPHGVCAISGALRVTVREQTLSIAAILSDLSQRIPDGPAQEQVRFLASELHAAIDAYWQKNIQDQRLAQPLTRLLLAPTVSTVLYAKRDSSGEMFLYQIFFPFRQAQHAEGGWLHTLRDPVIQAADAARPLAQGKTDCMNIRADEPPAVSTPEETLSTIRFLYQRSQQFDEFCRAIIGGPTRVAIIDPTGNARWVDAQ